MDEIKEAYITHLRQQMFNALDAFCLAAARADSAEAKLAALSGKSPSAPQTVVRRGRKPRQASVPVNGAEAPVPGA